MRRKRSIIALTILLAISAGVKGFCQGITKYGENTSTSSNFVNRYGEVSVYPLLTSFGKAYMSFSAGGSRANINLDAGSSITVDNVVYCYGGYLNNSYGSPELWSYTLSTDSWSQKTNAPVSRTNSAIAYNSGDGMIYIFGGNGAGDDYNDLHKYNPGSNSWIQVSSSVPGISARRCCSMGILNNKVYIIGGWEDSPGYLSSSYCYDLASNTTSSIANLPTVTAWGNMYCQVDNYIYIAGGQNTGGVLIKLQRYNISSNTWTYLADMPEARASCGTPLLYYNNALWIISGGSTTTILRYDITGNFWTTYSSNVTSRTNHWAGVSAAGKAMVWGGYNKPTEICTLP